MPPGCCLSRLTTTRTTAIRRCLARSGRSTRSADRPVTLARRTCVEASAASVSPGGNRASQRLERRCGRRSRRLRSTGVCATAIRTAAAPPGRSALLSSHRELELERVPPRHRRGEEPSACHWVGPWLPVTPVDLVPALGGGDTDARRGARPRGSLGRALQHRSPAQRDQIHHPGRSPRMPRPSHLGSARCSARSPFSPERSVISFSTASPLGRGIGI
jgi:hypothetical protein